MEKNSTTDWQKDPELVQVQERLTVERAKHREAADRIPSAEARLSELESQLADVEAFAAVGRKSSADVESAKKAAEDVRGTLRRYRGEAAVAFEGAAHLEKALETITTEAIQRADEFIRTRTAELTAKLETMLVPIAELNEELDQIFATARHTLPANGDDALEVKRAGVASCAGFQHSLSFMRPPTPRTIAAWQEMKNSALSHAERVSRRLRGVA